LRRLIHGIEQGLDAVQVSFNMEKNLKSRLSYSKLFWLRQKNIPSKKKIGAKATAIGLKEEGFFSPT